jgi:SPP1 family predicted phage head-tail adaptor
MKPGERKTSMVTLQRRGTAQDTAGQRIETWTTIRREWAAIETITGREFFAQSGEMAEATHRVVVWAGSEVQARDRVLFGTRVFDITAVLDHNDRELALMCVEVV